MIICELEGCLDGFLVGASPRSYVFVFDNPFISILADPLATERLGDGINLVQLKPLSRLFANIEALGSLGFHRQESHVGHSVSLESFHQTAEEATSSNGNDDHVWLDSIHLLDDFVDYGGVSSPDVRMVERMDQDSSRLFGELHGSDVGIIPGVADNLNAGRIMSDLLDHKFRGDLRDTDSNGDSKLFGSKGGGNTCVSTRRANKLGASIFDSMLAKLA